MCPLSSEIYQTFFPVSVFCFQACSEPFHWIKDQMRRLSSDHFNSHSCLWGLWRTTTVSSAFLPPPPSLKKMYLKQDASWGHLWATLSTVFLMLSETLAKHFTESWLPKVSDHCSGHRHSLSPSLVPLFRIKNEIKASLMDSPEESRIKPFLCRLWLAGV